MDNLTLTLNEQQLRANIDALQKGGLPNDKVQAYVDNYSKGGDGNYVLKSSGGALNPTPTPFLQGELMGTNKGNQGFLEGIVQNTVGSKGVLGTAQLPGKVINTAILAGGEKGNEVARGQLAQVTTALIHKVASLPDGDPNKATLTQQIHDNLKQMGMAQEASANITGNQTTPGEALGTAANAALTLAPFTKTGTSILKGSLDIAKLFPEAPTVLTKTLSFGKNLVPRMVTQGIFGSAVQSAYNLANDKPVGENVAQTGLISAAIPAVTTGLAQTFKYISSVFSGAPVKVLEANYANPDIIGQKVKEFAQNPDAGYELLTKAQKAFDQVAENRNIDYQKGLSEIENKYRLTSLKPGVGMGVVMQRPDGEIFTLTAKGVKDIFTKTTETLGTDASRFTPAETERLTAIKDLVYKWNNFTPTGLNDLAVRIGKYARPASQDLAYANTIIYQLKDSLRNYLGERVPEIAPLNQAYAQASSFMTRLTKEIGPAIKSSDKGSVTSAINKLTTLFSKSSPYREQMIQELGKQGGQDLMNEIVGATLAKWGPRWGTKIIDALVAGGGAATAELAGVGASAIGVGGIAAAGLASPRVVGTVGRIAARVTPVTNVVQKVAPLLIPKNQ